MESHRMYDNFGKLFNIIYLKLKYSRSMTLKSHPPPQVFTQKD